MTYTQCYRVNERGALLLFFGSVAANSAENVIHGVKFRENHR